MEKPPKPMTKIFRFLPRAASAVIAFQNLPFSAGRDKVGPYERANHHHNNNNHRFSGPLLPNKSFDDLGFDGPDPTSPKISCMGQIKHKKNKIKTYEDKIENRTKQRSKLKRFFSGKLEKAKPLVHSSVRDDCSQLPDRVPSLSQAKRFTSGRDVLAGFDWLAPITPVDKERRNYYSDDEERGGRTSSSGEEDEDGDEDKEDIIIPFSAPLPGVGMRPRKEVNLWKRRTMAPPRRLQLQY